MKNAKNIITLTLLGTFVLGLSGWAAVKPPDALSVSERRPLAQRPEMTAAGVLSGRFMSDYESYACRWGSDHRPPDCRDPRYNTGCRFLPQR